mgnify:CR=1 FL=1
MGVQNEDYAQGTIADPQLKRKIVRFLVCNVSPYDYDIWSMALHMGENVCHMATGCNNAVSSFPQNPLQTGEINSPRVRDNQR